MKIEVNVCVEIMSCIDLETHPRSFFAVNFHFVLEKLQR